jgi:hypothetical protein
MMGRTAIFSVPTVAWGAHAERRITRLSKTTAMLLFIESKFLSYVSVGGNYYGITSYQIVKIICFFALILTVSLRIPLLWQDHRKNVFCNYPADPNDTQGALQESIRRK